MDANRSIDKILDAIIDGYPLKSDDKTMSEIEDIVSKWRAQKYWNWEETSE